MRADRRQCSRECGSPIVRSTGCSRIRTTLRESLRGIECAAGAGLALKELREAKLRGEFGSYLQEALLADHFLTRGLRVSKGHRGNGRNPDLEIVADDFSVTVEAYSPRSWQWRKDWLDDVTDTLKYSSGNCSSFHSACVTTLSAANRAAAPATEVREPRMP